MLTKLDSLPKTGDPTFALLGSGRKQKCPWCSSALYHEGELTIQGGAIMLKLYCARAANQHTFTLEIDTTDEALTIRMIEHN